MSVTMRADASGSPKLNVANDNFAWLAEALNLPNDDWAGIWAGGVVLRAIGRLERAIAEGRGGEFTRIEYVDHRAGGCVAFSAGVDVDRLTRYMVALERVAIVAIKGGVPIYYG